MRLRPIELENRVKELEQKIEEHYANYKAMLQRLMAQELDHKKKLMEKDLIIKKQD